MDRVIRQGRRLPVDVDQRPRIQVPIDRIVGSHAISVTEWSAAVRGQSPSSPSPAFKKTPLMSTGSSGRLSEKNALAIFSEAPKTTDHPSRPERVSASPERSRGPKKPGPGTATPSRGHAPGHEPSATLETHSHAGAARTATLEMQSAEAAARSAPLEIRSRRAEFESATLKMPFAEGDFRSAARAFGRRARDFWSARPTKAFREAYFECGRPRGRRAKASGESGGRGRGCRGPTGGVAVRLEVAAEGPEGVDGPDSRGKP